ncbi:MAG: riboflavin synthase [Deltaproteobacteria bacterium]|nr:riboflavin synthase [Deltaproteobacteria bacterium]
MFGGIVEGTGTILRSAAGPRGGRELAIRTPFDDVKLGDSIAVNGVCLTATSIEGTLVSMDVGPETLERTTLGRLGGGDVVNLERALAYGDRIGGHLVQGHVDAVGLIRSVSARDNAIDLWVDVPRELHRYVAPRGGVAVDGISLTVTDVDPRGFALSVIPHTWKVTNLATRGVGGGVNVEVDLIARYLARLLETRDPNGLSLEKLEALGYGSAGR